MPEKPPKSDDTDENNDKTKKHIHVVLSESRRDKFEYLKKVYDQNSDVDVIRITIDKAYDFQHQHTIVLREELAKICERILSSEYLKTKYLLMTLNDIVNEAIRQYVTKINTEFNLHHFPFRKELSKDEQSVALVFIEHQYDFPKGMSLTNIMTFISAIPEIQVKKVIQKFLYNGLLVATQTDGIDYYFAPTP